MNKQDIKNIIERDTEVLCKRRIKNIKKFCRRSLMASFSKVSEGLKGDKNYIKVDDFAHYVSNYLTRYKTNDYAFTEILKANSKAFTEYVSEYRDELWTTNTIKLLKSFILYNFYDALEDLGLDDQ